MKVIRITSIIILLSFLCTLGYSQDTVRYRSLVIVKADVLFSSLSLRENAGQDYGSFAIEKPLKGHHSIQGKFGFQLRHKYNSDNYYFTPEYRYYFKRAPKGFYAGAQLTWMLEVANDKYFNSDYKRINYLSPSMLIGWQPVFYKDIFVANFYAGVGLNAPVYAVKSDAYEPKGYLSYNSGLDVVYSFGVYLGINFRKR